MFAAFDTAHITAIQSCLMGKPFLRHTKLASASSNTLAENVEIRVHAPKSLERRLSVHGV